MKYEGLADGAPGHGQWAEVEEDDQQQHEHERDRRVDGADQEAHHEAANQSKRTRVPRKVLERRPAIKQVETSSDIAEVCNYLKFVNTWSFEIPEVCNYLKFVITWSL